ncbi:MAG: nucleotidyl transferase AbiEii/AbiGii toxin family protein [Clostridiales bacterium]|nr:nucleotidyl transferase AbiEii/AbiGii toxin family protein [Clostridiales bacterium]
MVRGIESFRQWFQGYEDHYAIIGGTACDLLMTDEGMDFRATKDIDLVLIVEAIDASFGKRFWEYVLNAGYEHRNKSTGEPQFYRFTNPVSKKYPMMIELFTRKTDVVALPEEAVLSPLPIDENVSSLSAILLDDDIMSC